MGRERPSARGGSGAGNPSAYCIGQGGRATPATKQSRGLCALGNRTFHVAPRRPLGPLQAWTWPKSLQFCRGQQGIDPQISTIPALLHRCECALRQGVRSDAPRIPSNLRSNVLEGSTDFKEFSAFVSRCPQRVRSEEHTSELQSQSNLVCRLLLEKKKNKSKMTYV